MLYNKRNKKKSFFSCCALDKLSWRQGCSAWWSLVASLLSNQMVELRLQHEQERTHVLQQHNAEKDSLVQEHQREIQNLEEQARAAMTQYERSTQEWRKRDGQVGDHDGTSLLFRFFKFWMVTMFVSLIFPFSLMTLKWICTPWVFGFLFLEPN